MTRPARLARLARVVVLPLGAALLLGGCGADIRPGQAASVGSQSLSQSDADRIVGDVCDVLRAQAAAGGTGAAAPRYAVSALQTSVIQSWVQRAMAEQLAEEYDVTPGEDYEQTVAQARQQLAGVEESVRDRVLDVYTATPYFVSVVTAIGRSVLEDNGTAAPSDEDAIGQGVDTAQIWEADHPISTSPRYPDLELGDDSFQLTADESSVAVSDDARQAAEAQPSEEYLASLPSSQVCG